jgi:AcrR family transcriptional regulator
MKTAAANRVSIIDHASEALGMLGLANLTVSAVAERAKVSTALVHYHFDTKAKLLVATAERVAFRRHERRTRALGSASGLGAVDALWDVVAAGARDGLERAYVELLLFARSETGAAAAMLRQRRTQRSGMVTRLPALLRELGAVPASASDELTAALDATLDGLSLALLAGEDPAVVRTAYDAFWLTLLAAGQTRRR